MLLGWFEKGGQKEKEIGFHEGLRLDRNDLLRQKVIEVGALFVFEWFKGLFLSA
jgi:hypothetical protein